MRYYRGLQPLDGPGPLVAPFGGDAVLDPGLEEHLHPDADPEDGPSAGEAPADDLGALDRAQAGHAGGVRTDAGNDESVGLEGSLACPRSA